MIYRGVHVATCTCTYEAQRHVHVFHLHQVETNQTPPFFSAMVCFNFDFVLHEATCVHVHTDIQIIMTMVI